jgi:hypothetical protein
MVENQFFTTIKQLQFDGGGEYNSLQFQSFLHKYRIIHRKFCSHTSQQNGLAERKLRHVLETGLTLLAHAHLSNKYWVDTFLTAIYIINRLPTPVIEFKSPFFKLYHKEPDYQVLRVFGCKCYPLLHPHGLHKLEYRSKPCLYLGYHHAGYKCLDPLTNKVYFSRQVVFNESTFLAKEHVAELLPSKINAKDDTPFLPPVSISLPPYLSSNFTPNDISISSTCPHLDSPSVSYTNSSSILTSQSPSNSIDTTPSSESLVTTSPTTLLPSILDQSDPLRVATSDAPLMARPPTSHPMTTRSQTGSLKPKQFHGFKLYHSTKHPLQSFHTILSEKEPNNFTKAAANSRWQDAMLQEFQALVSNGTWTLCPRPLNHNIIRNKWVYKIKQKPDGSIERFKAWLVARGFEQQCGIDYNETFSPVIKPSTIRIILSLAIQFDWSIQQLDISNAFLHGYLGEEVFMEQPQGFIDREHPDYVSKLHKSLYGLKQAPRAWFNRLSSFLVELGFIASLVDPSLLIFTRGSIRLFMLIYVDDIILIGSHVTSIQSLISKVQSEFPLKDLRPFGFFSWYLGHKNCCKSPSMPSKIHFIFTS